MFAGDGRRGVVRAPAEAVMSMLLDDLAADMPSPVAAVSGTRCVIDPGGDTLVFAGVTFNGWPELLIRVRLATAAAARVGAALMAESGQESAAQPGPWTARKGALRYREFVDAQSLARPDPEAAALRVVSLRRRIAASTAHGQRMVFDAEHPAT